MSFMSNDSSGLKRTVKSQIQDPLIQRAKLTVERWASSNYQLRQ